MHNSERDILRDTTLVTWICSLVPVGFLALLGTMALHVRLGLGHWPTPMVEDHESALLGIGWRVLQLYFLFAVFVAPALWTVAVIAHRGDRRMRRVFGLQVFAFAAGCALVYGVFAWNPARFPEWFLD